MSYELSESHQRKLLSIEDKLKEHAFPPQLVIENTSACNQQCIHCSHKEMERPKKHMKRELWNKIVEEIGRESPHCEVWPTFYGEALVMGEEIWDRLDYAAEVGCENLVLNSNGTLLLSKNHIDRILKSPLKRFILSLDGFKKETYEKIRVHGKWDVVYPGVEKLLEERQRRGQVYPVIVCQYSMMKENEDEIDDFTRYWTERGAEVKVRPMLEWGSVGSIVSDRIDHATDFRIACPWGNNTMAIHQDGSVVTCAIDYEGKFKAGNANTSSLSALWKKLGEKLRTPHKCHDWKNVPDICKGCKDWQTAGAQYESSTVEGTRPFWYNEETDFKIAPLSAEVAKSEPAKVVAHENG